MGARAPHPPRVSRGLPPVRRGRKWSEEEVALLQTLELEFAGARNINILLEPYFPDKTDRQIRSKRSDLLRAKHRVERRVDAVSEGAAVVNPLPVIQTTDQDKTPTSNNIRIYRPVDSIPEDTDDDRAWKKALAASAMRTFHKQERVLKGGYFDLGTNWQQLGEESEKTPKTCRMLTWS